MIHIPNELINKLHGARVTILTGAGVSAESGVPTFRDAPESYWENIDPMMLASPEGFQANPHLVWGWYQHRRRELQGVVPNPGHEAIRWLEEYATITLVTQNVDRLHQAAGSKDVIELHGNIANTHCSDWQCREPMGVVSADVAEPPECSVCGSLGRPSVVWFGESLPTGEEFKAREAAQECDVFFSIGTSGAVYPAADLARIAKRRGAYLVEVNPEFTPLSDEVDCRLDGLSGEIMSLLLEKVCQTSEV